MFRIFLLCFLKIEIYLFIATCWDLNYGLILNGQLSFMLSVLTVLMQCIIVINTSFEGSNNDRHVIQPWACSLSFNSLKTYTQT